MLQKQKYDFRFKVGDSVQKGFKKLSIIEVDYDNREYKAVAFGRQNQVRYNAVLLDREYTLIGSRFELFYDRQTLE